MEAERAFIKVHIKIVQGGDPYDFFQILKILGEVLPPPPTARPFNIKVLDMSS